MYIVNSRSEQLQLKLCSFQVIIKKIQIYVEMATMSDSCFHTAFRFTADVSNLASNAVKSSVFELSNVDWKVKLLQMASNEDNSKKFLGVHLVSCLFQLIQFV